MFTSLLRHFTHSKHENESMSSSADERDKRRPPLRCTACDIWLPDGLVYMSNGGHYCRACARTVRAVIGSTPAGKRDDDIKTID